MGVKERKERERLRVREEIVEAAEKIFFSEGVQKAKMDEIAALAEVSKATLYTHFKSKNELIWAIHMRGSAILNKMSDTAFNEGVSIVESIKNSFIAYVDFHKEYPDYFNIMNYIIANDIRIDADTPEMKTEKEMSNESLAKWENLFVKAKADGVIRKKANAKSVAILMWLQMYNLLTSNHILKEIEDEYQITRETLIDDFFDITFYGIFEAKKRR